MEVLSFKNRLKVKLDVELSIFFSRGQSGLPYWKELEQIMILNFKWLSWSHSPRSWNVPNRDIQTIPIYITWLRIDLRASESESEAES